MRSAIPVLVLLGVHFTPGGEILAQQSTSPGSAGCQGIAPVKGVPRLPSGEQLQAWTREYYPDLAANAAAPARLVVGFILDDQCRVLRHSAGLLPKEYSEEIVLTLFPDVRRHGMPAGLADAVPRSNRGRSAREGPALVAAWLMQVNPGSRERARGEGEARTHEIRWTHDATAPRERAFGFQPARLEISAGEPVRFSIASGSPHLLAFDLEGMPPGAADLLRGRLPGGVSVGGALQSRFFTQPGEGFTLDTSGLPAGTYHIICSAHYALGEHGYLYIVAPAGAHRRTAVTEAP